jgi:L-fucose isomerase-like protein
MDLSEVFARINGLSETDPDYIAKKDIFLGYTRWSKMPDSSFRNIVKTSVVIDRILKEYDSNCMTLRCWEEFEKQLGIAPCVVLSELNDRRICASCEMDAMNAVAMRALSYATGNAAACLDWNNNYGDDPDKCILFHCGPIPQSMMTGQGMVKEHVMFKKAFGDDFGWGTNEGRLKPMPITLCSATTEDGRVRLYAEEGSVTQDPIEDSFFGCGGVCRMDDMQRKLLKMGTSGFRHHVSISEGSCKNVIEEALGKYLGYEIIKM